MTASVAEVIALVLEHEGGVADLGDGKGVTRFGQTKAWLDDWGFTSPRSRDDAAQNYEQWLLMTRIDAVCERDVMVGYMLADWAVHSGEGVAVKALQTIVRAKVDGVIGPKTLKAIEDANVRMLAHELLAKRVQFIGLLLGSQTVDRRLWAKGWCNRLAALVEDLGHEAA